MLLERFGEPIVGDRQGVPTSSKKKDMGNRGFGSKLEEDACCDQCGAMPMEMDGEPGACCQATAVEGDEKVDEVAPPGDEDVVKALKKKKGIKNPWAVAWSQHNKKHKR